MKKITKLYKKHDGYDYHEMAERVVFADSKEEAAKKLDEKIEEIEEIKEDVYVNRGCDC